MVDFNRQNLEKETSNINISVTKKASIKSIIFIFLQPVEKQLSL